MPESHTIATRNSAIINRKRKGAAKRGKWAKETHPITTGADTELFDTRPLPEARCSISSTSNPEVDVFSE